MIDMAERMSEEDIESLFSDSIEEQEKEDTPSKKESPENTKDNPAEDESALDPNNLFEDDETTPESVGGEEDNKEQKDASSKQGTSPVFSSLAKALQEDGILSNLDQENIDKITDVESFKEAVKDWITSNLDETQKRINDALDNGMDKDVVRQFENNLRVLDSITPESIKEEGDHGENLRKSLIYKDYIDRGFSKERAQREVERSINNGTDVEDAEEALRSIRENTQKKYDDALAEAKKEADDYAREQEKQASELKNSILKDNNLFGEVTVDKLTRQKILDNIVKPVYKDPETGDTYTALQKFEKEHRLEFLKLVSTFLTMTDWGKNLDGLVRGKVKKEVGKATKNLEQVINSTQVNGDGSLRFATGVAPESYFSDFKLDV